MRDTLQFKHVHYLILLSLFWELAKDLRPIWSVSQSNSFLLIPVCFLWLGEECVSTSITRLGKFLVGEENLVWSISNLRDALLLPLELWFVVTFVFNGDKTDKTVRGDMVEQCGDSLIVSGVWCGVKGRALARELGVLQLAKRRLFFLRWFNTSTHDLGAVSLNLSARALIFCFLSSSSLSWLFNLQIRWRTSSAHVTTYGKTYF